MQIYDMTYTHYKHTDRWHGKNPQIDGMTNTQIDDMTNTRIGGMAKTHKLVT